MNAVYWTLVALSGLLPGLAHSQAGANQAMNTVRISGRIRDQTGAKIPKATVKLKVAGLNSTPTMVHTDQDGAFAFQAEPLRRYELYIQMAGFKTTIRTIAVGSDKEFRTGDIVLQVSEASLIDRVEDHRRAMAKLTIQGIGGTSTSLSISDLSKLPQSTVKATSHGIQAEYLGVLLPVVLKNVELPVGGKFQSTGASYYLKAEARDGYAVVFAWAELDPTFMDKPIYVVTKRDGQPLSDRDGPFQLLVPGEKKSARSVRQVTALTIRQAN